MHAAGTNELSREAPTAPTGIGWLQAEDSRDSHSLHLLATDEGESGGVEGVVRRSPNEVEPSRLCTSGVYKTVVLCATFQIEKRLKPSDGV